MHDIRTGCIFDGPRWLSSWRNWRTERAYATTLFYDLKWFWRIINSPFLTVFLKYIWSSFASYIYMISRNIKKRNNTYLETNIKLNFLKLFPILEISWILFQNFDSIPVARKQGGTRDVSGRLDFIIRALLQIAAPAYRSRTGAFYYRLNPW